MSKNTVVKVQDITALMTLAGLDTDYLVEAGVDDLISNDNELAAAIASMEKEKRSNSIKAAANLIVELASDANRAIVSNAEKLREVRRHERELVTKIKAINTARDYAKETRNYLPLLIAIGVDAGTLPPHIRNSGKLEIPDNWKSKVKAKK